MKPKTAIEQLITWMDDEIINKPYYKNSPRFREGIKTARIKAIELHSTEREQIEEAYRNAQDDIDCVNGAKVIGFSAEFYYQQKYGDEPTIKND